jgi:hypothetical protein
VAWFCCVSDPSDASEARASLYAGQQGRHYEQ